MLDVRTLLFMMLLSCLLMAATLAALTLRRPWPGVRAWSASLFAQGLGWCAMLAAFEMHNAVSFGLGATLLATGMALQVHALDRFAGHDTHWPLVVGLVGLTAIANLPLVTEIPLRIGFFTACYAALRVLALRSVLRMHDLHGSHVMRLMVFFLGLSAAVLAMRALELIIGGFGAASLTSPLLRTLSESMAFSVGYAVVVVTTFGLLLLHRERTDAELRQLAEHDALTGLLNRRTFLQLAGGKVAQSRGGGASVTLLVLDLDRFKLINDRYGHPAGDRVLCDFAHVMSRTVSRDDLVGRLGGEEFAILLAGDDLPGALRLAERLRMTTERRCVEPEGIRYTVSIGVAEHDPVDTSGLAGLIGRADRALYRAKGEGRNRSVTGPIAAG